MVGQRENAVCNKTETMFPSKNNYNLSHVLFMMQKCLTDYKLSLVASASLKMTIMTIHIDGNVGSIKSEEF